MSTKPGKYSHGWIADTGGAAAPVGNNVKVYPAMGSVLSVDRPASAVASERLADATSHAGRSHRSAVSSALSAAQEGARVCQLYAVLALKLALVLTPLVVVAGLGALQAYASSDKVQAARFVRADIERADRLRVLVDRMQVERGTSCMFHSSKISGTDTDGSIERLRALRRRQTDETIAGLMDIEWVSDRYDTIDDFVDDWHSTRAMIDALTEDTCDRIMLTIHDQVTHLIRMMIQSLTKNSRLTRLLTAYGSWTLGVEFLGMRRGYGGGYFAAGTMDIIDTANYFKLLGGSDGLFMMASFSADELYGYERRLEAMNDSVGKDYVYHNYTMLQVMALEMASPDGANRSTSGDEGSAAQFWFATISQRIGLLGTLEQEVVQNLREVLNENVQHETTEFLMLSVSLLATIMLTIFATAYGVHHARSIHIRSKELAEQLDIQTEKLAREQQKMADLLLELLPRKVVKQLSMGKAVLPESYESVTVMFADIVGFTPLCAQSTPAQVVKLLNLLFTNVDEILDTHSCYKLETVGDCVVASSGVPDRCGDEHSANIAGAGLDIVYMLHHMRVPHMRDKQGVIRMRVGFHTGPVSAGVVGLRAPKFCLFGDTVNTASRMESNGMPLRVHLSSQAHEHLVKNSKHFSTKPRGLVNIKGKGEMLTYWVTGANGHPYTFASSNTNLQKEMTETTTVR